MTLPTVPQENLFDSLCLIELAYERSQAREDLQHSALLRARDACLGRDIYSEDLPMHYLDERYIRDSAFNLR